MKIRQAISLLGLLLSVSEVQSSRALAPLSELTTFGVMSVPVQTSLKVLSTTGKSEIATVCQQFTLEKVVKSPNVTIIDMDSSTLSSMVSLLHSLKPVQMPYIQGLLSKEELQYALKFEEEITRDFFRAMYYEFKFTTPHRGSLDQTIIIPVQFWPNHFEIKHAKAILSGLNLRNVIFMHLNDEVHKSNYEPMEYGPQRVWGWTDYLPWARRKDIPKEKRTGPHVTIMNHGKIMFNGTLEHSNGNFPGSEVLASHVISQARLNKAMLGEPKLEHYGQAGQRTLARLASSDDIRKYGYTTTIFRSGLGDGEIMPINDGWKVKPKNGNAYEFTRAQSKQ